MHGVLLLSVMFVSSRLYGLAPACETLLWLAGALACCPNGVADQLSTTRFFGVAPATAESAMR